MSLATLGWEFATRKSLEDRFKLLLPQGLCTHCSSLDSLALRHPRSLPLIPQPDNLSETSRALVGGYDFRN